MMATMPPPFETLDCSDCTVVTAATAASERSYLNSVTGALSNVLDDYVILPTLLGEGRHGIVRECVHRRTGKKYACKTVDKSYVVRLDRLQNEIEILSSLDHPSVLKMMGCYEDAERVHIVTEKCAGGDLFEAVADRADDGGCFSEPEAAQIAAPLLEAVAHLHERGCAHRDLKLENVMFASERRGDIKLVDFGLAQRHGEGEGPMSDRVGTAYYMAPELLRRRYTKSCDLWSVGAILYILLCGSPPFDGDNDHDVHRSVLRGEYQFHLPEWADVSEEAKDLVAGLLEKDPRRRYTAAEALRHPWLRKVGRRRGRREERRKSALPGRRRADAQPPIKYLRIP